MKPQPAKNFTQQRIWHFPSFQPQVELHFIDAGQVSGRLIRILSGDQSLVVSHERPLRFPYLLVELAVGLTVRGERERLPVKVQDAPQVVGERIVQILVCDSRLHVISLSSLLH
jgi:hypothetical protein